MTRKDFELIAATLKGARDGTSDNRCLLDERAHDFANRLKLTNAQFNRYKFLRECGVTP